MIRIGRALAGIVLGGWLGAAVLVAWVVAPHAFASFPTRAEAGTFVGGVLRILDGWAIGAGVAALGAVLLDAGSIKRARRIRIAGSFLVLLSGIASLVLDAKIGALRAAMGPVDLVAPDDPRRVAFGMWHGISMVTLLIGMIGAASSLLASAFD